MSAQVFCRGCYTTFPAPSTLAEEDEVVCPHCGKDTHAVLKNEVAELVRVASEGSVRRAAQLPPLPRESLEVLRAYWTEVRWAYMLRQYSASLLLGTSFLEFLLKQLLGPASRATTLHAAINAGSKQGLFDSGTETTLIEIKNHIRNRYAHGDYASIAGDPPVRAVVVHRSQGKTTVATADLKLREIPRLQVRQKVKNDELYATEVLHRIYNLASNLVQRNAALQRVRAAEA